MKYQVIFSWKKNKSKKIKVLSAVILLDALRVKMNGSLFLAKRKVVV